MARDAGGWGERAEDWRALGSSAGTVLLLLLLLLRVCADMVSVVVCRRRSTKWEKAWACACVLVWCVM